MTLPTPTEVHSVRWLEKLTLALQIDGYLKALRQAVTTSQVAVAARGAKSNPKEGFARLDAFARIGNQIF